MENIETTKEMETQKQEKYELFFPSVETIDSNHKCVMKNLDKIIIASTKSLADNISKEIRRQSNIPVRVIEFKNYVVKYPHNIDCYEKCDFDRIFSELKIEFGENCIEGDPKDWIFYYNMDDKSENNYSSSGKMWRRLAYDQLKEKIEKEIYSIQINVSEAFFDKYSKIFVNELMEKFDLSFLFIEATKTKTFNIEITKEKAKTFDFKFLDP